LSIVSVLSDYISTAVARPLPEDVQDAASRHTLDTLAAIVSGSVLPAGEAGIRYAWRQPRADEAMVIGSEFTASAGDAALANAMSGHADETDDSHEFSLTHPGCGIVPTALAVAEREGRSGEEFLRAVALGYDICGRITRAAWPDRPAMRAQHHSTHAIGPIWGAAAAAASLASLEADRIPYVLSYTAQQTAGLRTMLRDGPDHIEKAFVFGGMAASNALRTIGFIEAGWTGVDDVFTGFPNFFDAFGKDSDPEFLISELGSRFVIAQTNLKRFSIGSPAQAPIQGVVDLLRDEGLDKRDVSLVRVRMSRSLGAVVSDRGMPNINLEYLVSAALADGDLSFAASHDTRRFEVWQADRDPRVVIELDEAIEPTLQAFVRIEMSDGRVFERHETEVRGTGANPMPTDEVVAKALDLCAPVLGEDVSRELIERVMDPRRIGNVRDLRPLLMLP